MPKFGWGKEKKENTPQKSVMYVLNNVGRGVSCEYAQKVNELTHIPLTDKDGKATTMNAADACTKALEALGLPSGISYFAQGRKLFVDEDAKNKIEKDVELGKKFRKALGIDEKQELKFEKYL
jgi:hypothetical protein